MMCDFCGKRAWKRRIFSREESIALAECGECHLQFLSPQPSPARLSREYQNYFEKRRVEGAVWPKAAFFSEMFACYELDFSGKRVLEVGPGEGDCLATIRETWPTADLFTLDAHHGLKVENVSVLRGSVEEWLDTGSNEKFDFILMFDVLEHVRAPGRVMDALARRHLQQNGRIIATFPWAESLSRKLMGPLWPHYKLEHLYYFSTSAVQCMAEQSGLETEKLEPLVKRLPLSYWFQIAGSFGPEPTKKIARLVRALMPRRWGPTRVSIPTGEAIWIASSRRGVVDFHGV